jgi:hypothetical protein
VPAGKVRRKVLAKSLLRFGLHPEQKPGEHRENSHGQREQNSTPGSAPGVLALGEIMLAPEQQSQLLPSHQPSQHECQGHPDDGSAEEEQPSVPYETDAIVMKRDDGKGAPANQQKPQHDTLGPAGIRRHRGDAHGREDNRPPPTQVQAIPMRRNTIPRPQAMTVNTVRPLLKAFMAT